MKLSDKKKLLKKAQHHEAKAREYYATLEVLEREESLIGFKTKGDNRVSSDKHQISIPQLFNEPEDWHEAKKRRKWQIL